MVALDLYASLIPISFQICQTSHFEWWFWLVLFSPISVSGTVATLLIYITWKHLNAEMPVVSEKIRKARIGLYLCMALAAAVTSMYFFRHITNMLKGNLGGFNFSEAFGNTASASMYQDLAYLFCLAFVYGAKLAADSDKPQMYGFWIWFYAAFSILLGFCLVMPIFFAHLEYMRLKPNQGWKDFLLFLGISVGVIALCVYVGIFLPSHLLVFAAYWEPVVV